MMKQAVAILALYMLLGNAVSVTALPLPDLGTEMICSLCLDIVKIAQNIAQSNQTLDDILPEAMRICVWYVGEPEAGAYMCPGLLSSYGPVVEYVVAKVVLDPHEVCEFLDFCANVNNEKGNTHHIGMLRSNIGRKTHERSFKTSPEDPLITFVQISDIHLDPDYAEGSSSDCGLYMCCRAWYNGSGHAGHYGSHNCDLPLVTLDLLLNAIKNLTPQPEFIVYTGDNPSHEIWNETWSSQLNATEFVVSYLAMNLPNMTIYPAIGNHESWPESEYIGTLTEYQHLTSKLAEYWQRWVNFPQDALDSIAKGGYYCIKVMNDLRVISFNSNYGYKKNFYSFLNHQNKHYHEQLNWIEEQLAMAELEGDKVIMIGHIPPGDSDNHAEYGEFYLNITKQFSETIIGHLFGHTHRDQFQLVQDEQGVHGVVLIAPSVTPYPAINPSFRVFTMNQETMQLVGYEQYHLNLTKANDLYHHGSHVQPKFELFYNTFDEYKLGDLSAKSWADLVERFYQFPMLLDKYFYNIRGRFSDSDRHCDKPCQHDTLCSVSNIISSNYSQCVKSSNKKLHV